MKNYKHSVCVMSLKRAASKKMSLNQTLQHRTSKKENKCKIYSFLPVNFNGNVYNWYHSIPHFQLYHILAVQLNRYKFQFLIKFKRSIPCVRFMCITHKPNVQQENVLKPNASAILAADQVSFSISLIYH